MRVDTPSRVIAATDFARVGTRNSSRIRRRSYPIDDGDRYRRRRGIIVHLECIFAARPLAPLSRPLRQTLRRRFDYDAPAIGSPLRVRDYSDFDCFRLLRSQLHAGGRTNDDRDTRGRAYGMKLPRVLPAATFSTLRPSASRSRALADSRTFHTSDDDSGAATASIVVSCHCSVSSLFPFTTYCRLPLSFADANGTVKRTRTRRLPTAANFTAIVAVAQRKKIRAVTKKDEREREKVEDEMSMSAA